MTNTFNTEATDILSPCVRNCCLDSEDICVGCSRHIDEILVWGKASVKEKIHILQQVEQRKNGY